MPRGTRSCRLRLLVLGFGSLAAAWLLTACDPNAITLVVNSLADAPDAQPGDGVCETSTPGDCTLRAAVMEANAHLGDDIIEVGDGQTYLLGLAGGGEDEAATGDLDITEDVTIRGRSTIDAGGLDRVMHVLSGRLSLGGTTISGGRAQGGGGIRVNNAAVLSLVDVEVTGNVGDPATGGIHAGDSAVTLVASAVTDNSAGTLAGGIRTLGPLVMVNSTVSGNDTTSGTGGVAVAGATAADLQQVTVTDNAGPVGGASGSVELSASVVADQAAGPDCAATATSSGGNADSDGSCLDGSGSGDLPSVDPLLGPLALNGGTTRNHLPVPGSPLLDAVAPGTELCGAGFGLLDQRSQLRPLDSDGDAVPACEMGAVESAGLVVNHGGDRVDASPGDRVCQDAGGAPGDCSLRAAIGEANALPGPDSIAIEADVGTVNLSRTGVGEDANGTGDLDISSPLAIEGNGVTVDAHEIDRVVHHQSGTVHLVDLTITGGLARVIVNGGFIPPQLPPPPPSADVGNGGGIYTSGNLDLRRTSVGANTAGGYVINYIYCPATACYSAHDFDPGWGGGIFATGAVTVTDSVVQDNLAVAGGTSMEGVGSGGIIGGRGGGIFGGPLVVINSTVSGNVAQDTLFEDHTANYASGGGIDLAGSTATITNSTITGNSLSLFGSPLEAYGVGAALANGTATLMATTVSDNLGWGSSIGQVTLTVHGSILKAGLTASACSAAASSSTFTIASDSSCGLAPGGGNLQSVDPMLGALGPYGGPTPTQVPMVGSPALNAIPFGTAGLCDVTTATDQRGLPRPQGGACDVGAVERQASDP